MKISLHWLRQMIPGLTTTPGDLADDLTRRTCEVEEVLHMKEKYAEIYAGALRSASIIKEGLHAGQFDLGALGIQQIVFGNVHPLQVGKTYPIALEGAVIMGKRMEPRTVSGEKSMGMVCDCTELGMKRDGILELTAKPGTPFSDITLAASDVLIDIDNKSLTHRPDLMGHVGFGREVGALTGAGADLSVAEMPAMGTEKIDVKIATDGCRRFMACRVNGVTVQAAPLQTQLMLEHLGTRTISNLVDVTNHVLLFRGQPMHVFDADKITGKITVRNATVGESLIALDGEEYELTPDDIVIADEAGVLSIAGIMGGLASGTTMDTKNVMYECANFDPVRIRKTAARLGLRSESSMRYEKSLAPEQCANALQQALHMTAQLCPGATLGGITDAFPAPTPELIIPLSPTRARTISGIDMSDATIQHHLESVGFTCEIHPNLWQVTVPWWRATKDISIEADLLEEVIRLHGFDTIPTVMPHLAIDPPPPNMARAAAWRVRSQLALMGYHECMHRSFIAEGVESGFENRIEVQNPLSDNQRFMRRTLILPLLNQLETPLRAEKDLSLFEVGKTFLAGDTPHEDERICVVRASLTVDENDLFQDVKQAVQHVFVQARLSLRIVQNTNAHPMHHPGKTADLYVNGQHVGVLAVMHPHQAPATGAHVAYAEWSLAALAQPHDATYTQVSAHADVTRDISILVAEDVAQADIMQTITQATEVHGVDLVDRYRSNAKLGHGMKNLVFRIVFRPGKTPLTDEEISAPMSEIAAKIIQKHHAQIR